MVLGIAGPVYAQQSAPNVARNVCPAFIRRQIHHAYGQIHLSGEDGTGQTVNLN
jgi:hypothetical protein